MGILRAHPTPGTPRRESSVRKESKAMNRRLPAACIYALLLIALSAPTAAAQGQAAAAPRNRSIR